MKDYGNIKHQQYQNTRKQSIMLNMNNAKKSYCGTNASRKGTTVFFLNELKDGGEML